MRPLYPFIGGLELAPHKAISLAQPIRNMALPEYFYLPAQSASGKQLDVKARVGDTVQAGALLAEIAGLSGTKLHSPALATLASIAPHPLADGREVPHLVLKSKPSDTLHAEPTRPDQTMKSLSASSILERIDAAGIVGMGGAGFPTAIKYRAKAIETLVINAAECEPYISCDAALIIAHSEAVIRGIDYCRQALGAKRCIIALEANNQAAIAVLRAALADDPRLSLSILPNRYPVGSERSLIQSLFNIRLAPKQRPNDVQLMCSNVATAFAVYQAIEQDRALTQRLVTLSGDALEYPGNYWVAVGTPIALMLEQVGAQRDARLNRGGPMMQKPLSDASAGLLKSDNCVLIRQPSPKPAPSPCIRCGQCEAVCPEALLPQQLHWHVLAGDLNSAEDFSLDACIACACCDYVCPSDIPLAAQFKSAQIAVFEQRRQSQRADLARQRHDARAERLAQAAEARKAAMAEKKARLKKQHPNAG